MNRLFIAISLSICLVAPSWARAATALVESLEWAVVSSDLVIRGTITEVERVRDKQEVIWSTVTVKVADTLKGEKAEQVKFVAGHKSRFASDQLTELRENKAEALFCLVKSERYKSKGTDYAGAPWALRLPEGEQDCNVLDLSDKSSAYAVSLDARVLTGREEILKAASDAKATPAPKQGRLRAPASADVVRKLAEGGSVWILVPLDARLEQAAKDWLKGKELDYRVEGARTLRHFKSDSNIDLLKALLEDGQSMTDGKSRSFPVRLASFEVLKSWGVEVKKPVTEE